MRRDGLAQEDLVKTGGSPCYLGEVTTFLLYDHHGL
jgi:hypothetical protein